VKTILTSVLLLAALGFTGWGAAFGESIAGKGCYTYGEGETFIAAKHISISIAKRAALEGYQVFSEATSHMEDPQLKNELIANLSARVLKDVKITKTEEDRQKREVCTSLTAQVAPERLQAMAAAVFNSFYNRKGSLRTGLPESEHLRIVRMDEFPCAFDQNVQCLRLVLECKKNSFGARLPIRIIWYDVEGLPAFSIKRRVACERPRDVENFQLRLPPGDYTFNVDLP
jgi:hypothetical protein